VAELQAALALDPKLPQAHLLLGQGALFRGRLEEAVASFGREIQLNPGNAMAWYLMGDAHSRAKRFGEAKEALQRSLWINPYFSGPYVVLGNVYLKQGQPALAEGMLRKAVGYDPNNRTAHYLLAQSLQALGRAEEAKAEFQAAERLQAPRDR
jgi:tetratricopeptide (TPR) repeat protein